MTQATDGMGWDGMGPSQPRQGLNLPRCTPGSFGWQPLGGFRLHRGMCPNIRRLVGAPPGWGLVRRHVLLGLHPRKGD
jgi:hypothetical protein